MIKNKDKFAIFILTHGRANNVITYNTLIKQGYTGKIYIIVDDEDKQLGLYKEKFGNRVIVFSKKDISGKFDIGGNFKDKAAVIYARNECFNIAKRLGLDYFMEYDDDYTNFDYRLYQFGNPKPIKNLDKLLDTIISFYKNTDTYDLSMSQGGDFIGGSENKYATNPTLTRKCMNTHILSPLRKFDFIGKMNEDVSTPVVLGSIGKLFFTVPFISITQVQTQQSSGGLTDMYLDRGTYVKSFYSVMYAPSSCKVSVMGESHFRIHHKVKWNNAVPKIISESLKKK